MPDEANLAAVIIPAAFSFRAAVAGLLWNDYSKRRDVERGRAHHVNAIRRILSADLDAAGDIAGQVVADIRQVGSDGPKGDKAKIFLPIPKIRNYCADQISALTVAEIEAVLNAIRVVDSLPTLLQKVLKNIALSAHANSMEIVQVDVREARQVLPAFESTRDTCGIAVRELRAETGPA